MSLEIQVVAEPGLLRVIATGPFSLIQAEEKFTEMMDAVDRNKSEKIFVDGRKVTGNPRFIERFLYGEFAAAAVARYLGEGTRRHTPQFAYVLHEPVLDPNRFGETVAVNRGMWIKVFDRLEDALKWLREDMASDEFGPRIGPDGEPS